jgi:hypothetical protein
MRLNAHQWTKKGGAEAPLLLFTRHVDRACQIWECTLWDWNPLNGHFPDAPPAIEGNVFFTGRYVPLMVNQFDGQGIDCLEKPCIPAAKGHQHDWQLHQ